MEKEKIKIQLALRPGAPFFETEIEKGQTLESIVRAWDSARREGEKLPYYVLLARVDNLVRELTVEIYRPCKVTFLDMRDPVAMQTYRGSVSMLFLKALQDVIGPCPVRIENSLSGGYYSELEREEGVSEEELRQVRARMEELVEEDVPIKLEWISSDLLRKQLAELGEEDRLSMLNDADIPRVPVYSLLGMKDIFYSLMVPSTGYLKHFELRRYESGILLRFPTVTSPDRIPPYEAEPKMFEAFCESKRWGTLMEVNSIAELNRKIKSGESVEMIQICEALMEKQIANMADRIVNEGKRMVLIAGPSSSGKTTFTKRLCVQLRVLGKKTLYLGTDDYFLERSETPRDANGEFNFEGLDALDLPLFNRNMTELLEGGEADLPRFDFLAGGKVFGERITRLENDQIIVVEGIHGLNEKLSASIPRKDKFKIYISPLTQLNIDAHNRIPTTAVRLLRRIVRDNRFRGYSAEQTLATWPKVRMGEDVNIFPFNNAADAFFNSAYLYELSVLKKYAQPLLRCIAPESEVYNPSLQLWQFLQLFRSIDDDRAIANNSILREFIGGSVFAD